MSLSRKIIQDLLQKARTQQDALALSNEELERQTAVLKESESELQTQQEELRVTNEELEEQTRALKESESELQAQQEELRVTNEELEGRTQDLEHQKDAFKKKNTDLVKAREEIQQKAHDLEISGRYKSEFLANMSHELRTPLNSILILSQLFSRNRDGNLTEKQIEAARAIHSSGEDLLTLINEILDLSKVEAGKIELVLEDVALEDVVQDLKRLFKDVAGDRGVAFEIDVEEELCDTIHSDSQRLGQILRNLLTNAFKFTKKGTVTLAIGRPEESMASQCGLLPDNSVAFAVMDQGVGIPLEQQEMIFNAFQQADGSTSRKYGGTGLGLSISRELSRLLGGGIFLESQEGKGSSFTVVVPRVLTGKQDESADPSASEVTRKHGSSRSNSAVAPAAGKMPAGEGAAELTHGQDIESPAGKVPESAEPMPGQVKDDRRDITSGDKTLLIIEDDPYFAGVMSDFARERGFKCIVAEDGETGLHFADYYKPSAIILDIGLPGIDGWTVMERLKDNLELRSIPVHFISAEDSSMEAMRMGAVGFLTKPVTMESVDAAFTRIEDLITRPIKKLLVVEDDRIQQESICQLMDGGDVETVTVSTGREAFQELSNHVYDCMILDLGLEDMSGFELLEKIRSSRTPFRVPIIIYTGRELSRDEEMNLRRYAESIIIKGVKSPERLLDESALFLHRVEQNLPGAIQAKPRMVHDRDAVLEGKRVLLVDDDMRNVFALSSVLEDKNMEVVVARDGLEALEKLKAEEAVDLVLMDIMMPKMDGYEAMQKIRKMRKFKELPIIALTAKAMKGDRNKCVEAGASDYLAKPVDTGKLISMLRVWLYS